MKKIILSLSLFVTIISATSITTYAASNTNNVNEATIPVNQMTRTNIVYPPEGGMWEYGTNATHVWSHYYHETRDHYSGVEGMFGRKESPRVSARSQSRCDAIRKPWGNVSFYGF